MLVSGILPTDRTAQLSVDLIAFNATNRVQRDANHPTYRKELSHLSVEVKRKKGENFDSFLRRFQRRFQQSGRGLQAKKIRFLKDEPNRNKRRASALRRNVKRAEYEYLLKTGQLKEEPKRKGRR
jgi:ribosomal protein S21